MQAIINKNPGLVKIELKVETLSEVETLELRNMHLLEELIIYGTELLVLKLDKNSLLKILNLINFNIDDSLCGQIFELPRLQKLKLISK